MRLIYGTGNPAKVKSMRVALEPLGIDVVGVRALLADLPEIEENGTTPLENARIKALAYYKILHQPVFACDSGLYIQGLPEHEQPGMHVRMVKGKRLNDAEMLAYYSIIAERMGGRAQARYINGICVVLDEHTVYEHMELDISGNAFYLVTEPHPRTEPGFPLDSISVDIASGAYYYDNVRPQGDVGIAEHGFRQYFRSILQIE